MSRQGRLDCNIAVRRRMIKEGYREINEREIKLYMVGGPENFRTAVQSAFDFTYHEAKFLNIDSSSEQFYEISKVRRANNIEAGLLMIALSQRENPERIICFERMSEEEMKEIILKKYAPQTQRHF